ncbi:MAG: hypothetical protein RIC36_07830 [Rhodospirillales bacterium]
MKMNISSADDLDRVHEISFDAEALWSYILTRIRAIGALDRIPLLTGFPDWALLRAFSDIDPEDTRLLAVVRDSAEYQTSLSLTGAAVSHVWLVASTDELNAAISGFGDASGHGLIFCPDDVAITSLSAHPPLPAIREAAEGGVLAIAAPPAQMARALTLRQSCAALGLQPALIRVWQMFPVPAADLDALLASYDALVILDRPGSALAQGLSTWRLSSALPLPVRTLAPDLSGEAMIDSLFTTATLGDRFEDPR